MKKLLIPLGFCLVLVACNEAGDTQSSRGPRGNPNAAVLVEEFGDLQCPACKSAHTRINEPLLATYSDKIRFEFRHFPLRSIHRYALDAAEASECAADQGKFWEFVDLAYEKQDDLDTDALSAWAEELALDTAAFDSCMSRHRKRDLVLNEYRDGRDRGVGGTPTYFVNGQRVDTGVDTLSEAIDSQLEGMMQRL